MYHAKYLLQCMPLTQMQDSCAQGKAGCQAEPSTWQALGAARALPHRCCQGTMSMGEGAVAHVQAHEVVDARAHEVDAGAAPRGGVGGQRAVQVEQQGGPGVGRALVQEPGLPAAAARAARRGRTLGSAAAREGHRIGALLLLLLLAWASTCKMYNS